MKKLITLFFFIATAANVLGQFKISGRVTNGSPADTLYINVPFVFGYYHDNDVAIPVSKDGKFSTTLNIRQQKFGNIRLGKRTVCLLLTPGKSVHVEYNASKNSVAFTGSAATENWLMDQLDLNGIPFFTEDESLAKLNYEDIQQKVIAPWASQRDAALELISASSLPAHDKLLITQEVKANYIIQLNTYSRAIMDRSHRSRIDSVILYIYKDEALKPAVMPAGPIYYNFVNSYISYQETKVFSAFTPQQVKDPSTFVKEYGLTIDSGNRLAKLKGKSYINWLLVKNTFPGPLAEPWLAQSIAIRCSEKDLSYSKPLLEEMKQTFPNSPYLPHLTASINRLEAALVSNRANKEIRIAEGYDKMKSIYEVINQFKGKVVYLDVWGTWCGPCKEELRYTTPLKHRFAGKDVAFLYLDMDEDVRDADWKEFIKVNGITGLHLRKSRAAIDSFWDELVPKDKGERYYPMYFVFDKNGKLVEANAKRPSQKAELYAQIEKYL